MDALRIKSEAATKRVNAALDRDECPIDEDIMLCDIPTLTRAGLAARARAGYGDEPLPFRLR